MPVPGSGGSCVLILKVNRALLVVLAALLLLAAASGHSDDAPSGPKEFYQQLVANGGRYQDEPLQQYITELGEQIVAVSPMAGQPFTFTVVDSADMNAFAMADNFVYINRGLLAYVSNEAQLVSVLAHEVAHVTLDHVAGTRGAMIGAQIASFIAAVLSGSGDVYQAGIAYAESIRSGHGRDNELDADREGAKYMAALGYPSAEMLAMLSVMKDYEQLMKARARARGATRPTYHGVFASHPRNDARLRNAVLPANEAGNTALGLGEARYRAHTEGLIWGDNFVDKIAPPHRYSDLPERIRIDFPQDWRHRGTLAGEGVVSRPSGEPAAPSEGQTAEQTEAQPPPLQPEQASLTVTSLPRTLDTPEEFIYNQLRLPPLTDGAAISPARLAGFSGIQLDDGGRPYRRVAVVYSRYNAYLIVGEVSEPLRNEAEFAALDQQFVEAIATFRPISQREIAGQRPQRINYVRANAASSMDSIAKQLGLSDADRDELRMINGFYPRGEPEPGQWLKIFRQ